jgi:hypothetical protein
MEYSLTWFVAHSYRNSIVFFLSPGLWCSAAVHAMQHSQNQNTQPHLIKPGSIPISVYRICNVGKYAEDLMSIFFYFYIEICLQIWYTVVYASYIDLYFVFRIYRISEKWERMNVVMSDSKQQTQFELGYGSRRSRYLGRLDWITFRSPNFALRHLYSWEWVPTFWRSTLPSSSG